MGVYYNPVSDIENGLVGRPLGTQEHAAGKSRLKEGEHLYAFCDRGIFKQMVCVDDEEEYKEFFRQYQQGDLLSFDLYALAEESHEKALGGVEIIAFAALRGALFGR